ncbi:MAG: hypothetical protein JWN88_2715, partial [Frankiales bacterium]|nr:hypothetical protein [Frankiales bacterium]
MSILAADGVTGSLAGPAALLVVLLLFIATVLLVRNMDRRLRRLPTEFPPPGDRKGGTRLVEIPPDEPL